MSADRRISRLLTSMALLMSTGCQAVTTMAAIGVMLLLGAPLTAGPRLDAQPPSTPAVERAGAGVERAGAGDQKQPSAPGHEEILLQGCVARDDGWRPAAPTDVAGATGVASPPAEDRGEMFVLRDASRIAAAAGGRNAERSGGEGELYRLLPRSGVSLSTFEGQRVEVRGRLRGADDGDRAPSAVDHRNSQAVQGGQMQAVGQTMSPGQGGQSGQSTAASPEAKTRATSGGDTADPHPTVIVTSVRMLAPTCQILER